MEFLGNTLGNNVFDMRWWKFVQHDYQLFNLLGAICANVGVTVPDFDSDNETFVSSLQIVNTIKTLEQKVNSALSPINRLSITERLLRLATHYDAWQFTFSGAI